MTAAGGLAANALVVRLYDRVTLGYFSAALSLLLIGGQVVAAGQPSGVAFHVPARRAEGRDHRPYAHAGLLNVAQSAAVSVAILVTVNETVVGASFRHVLRGVYVALFLYPVSKVLLSHLNGLGRTRDVAIANASRFAVLPVAVVGLFSVGGDAHSAIWAITIAEVFVVCWLGWQLRSDYLDGVHVRRGHSRELWRFGRRSMWGTIVLDVNTRVDVMVLSVMRGADSVGRYSMASALAEGLFQLFMVTRVMVEPWVAALWSSGSVDELVKKLRQHVRMMSLLAIPVGIGAVVTYPVVARLLYGESESTDTYAVFVVLAIGIIVSSGFIPFTNLLSQMGDPTGYSLGLFGLAGANLCLNLILVPSFGAVGAAAGTALSQVMLVPMLIVLAKRRRGVEIL